jgi:hypothetical protein
MLNTFLFWKKLVKKRTQCFLNSKLCNHGNYRYWDLRGIQILSEGIWKKYAFKIVESFCNYLCNIPRRGGAPLRVPLYPQCHTEAGIWRGTDGGRRPLVGAGWPDAPDFRQLAHPSRHTMSVTPALSLTWFSLLQNSFAHPCLDCRLKLSNETCKSNFPQEHTVIPGLT